MEYSWEASTFQRLRDHQVARGFDPTTTDFAQQLGYSIFDIVNQPLPSCFEELDNSETSPEPIDFSLGILFGDTRPTDEPSLLDLSDISTNKLVASAQTDITETEDGDTKDRKIWSGFMSKFSWAAVDSLDIHAAAF
ncbi:hypothetical protein V5O48_007668 [Marasmius crinis-equi]|uniref:Uncharacterized protein n=1 Tax=Marasmius crinis-equi TaxID=585013 RepID=A0ABR3FG94_9AGAR